MKILHVAPHYGAGVGTVVSGWISKDSQNAHRAYSLDLCIDRKVNSLFVQTDDLRDDMKEADIVLVHYWDSPFLGNLLSRPLPECRLIFWVHKHYPIPEDEVLYPDRCFGTSRIQYLPDWIWSTGDISRFLEIKSKAHHGFNVGYVGGVSYQGKMHPNIFDLCDAIDIPDVHFTFVGENKTAMISSGKYTFIGKVDDVAPYLAEFDVPGYPLRSDHWGTCEQVIGEAMSAGVVPVLMDNPAERLIWKGCKSEAEYIEMVDLLYRNPELREAMSDGCRERAKELYSIDTMISRWNDIFDEMMTQPKRSRKELR